MQVDRMKMRMSVGEVHRYFLAFVCGFALVAFGSVETSLAHEETITSNPATDSTIPRPPEQVTVTFTGEVEAEGSSIQVLGPDGETVGDGGTLDLNNADRNTLVASLPEGLGPGEYTVEWEAVDAEDGDEFAGSFTFTFDPDAAEQVSPVIDQPEGTSEAVETTDVDADDDGGLGRGALIVGGVAIAVALIVVATLGRRAFWR